MRRSWGLRIVMCFNSSAWRHLPQLIAHLVSTCGCALGIAIKHSGERSVFQEVKRQDTRGICTNFLAFANILYWMRSWSLFLIHITRSNSTYTYLRFVPGIDPQHAFLSTGSTDAVQSREYTSNSPPTTYIDISFKLLESCFYSHIACYVDSASNLAGSKHGLV